MWCQKSSETYQGPRLYCGPKVNQHAVKQVVIFFWLISVYEKQVVRLCYNIFQSQCSWIRLCISRVRRFVHLPRSSHLVIAKLGSLLFYIAHCWPGLYVFLRFTFSLFNSQTVFLVSKTSIYQKFSFVTEWIKYTLHSFIHKLLGKNIILAYAPYTFLSENKTTKNFLA